MRVRFYEIEAKDFMSFERLRLPFGSRGLFLVLGSINGNPQDSNGAGKSSVFEALSFALFGKTIRSIPIAKVIRSGQQQAEVSLTFAVDQSEFKIVRKRNRSGGSLEFYRLGSRDGDLERWDGLTGSTMTETDAKIRVTLKCSYDLFVNSIFYGQGLPYRFVSAPDTEKKAIMEDVLGLGWTAKAKERTAEAFGGYERMENSLNFQKQGVQHEIQFASESVDSASLRMSAAEADIESAKTDIFKLRESLRSAPKVLPLETMKENIEKHEEELLEFENEREAVRNRQGVFIARESRLTGGQELFEREIASLEERERAFRKDSRCPLCGSLLNTSLSDEKAESAGNEKEEKIRLLEAQKQAVILIMKEKHALIVELTDLSKKIEKSKKGLQQARSVLELAKASEFVSERLEVANENLLLAEARKTTAGQEAEGCLERKRGAEEELKNLEEAISGAKSMIAALGFWQRGFGNKGLKSYALSYVAPILNAKARHYASRLLWDGCEVDFSLDDSAEKFLVNVRDVSRGVSYEQFSGGEKRRADVVVMLALGELISMRNGHSVALQVFDEVCENLDVQGVESLVSLLREMAEERAIYVVSHNTEFSALFERFLMVTKNENGISEASIT